jgi:hypothetical protein
VSYNYSLNCKKGYMLKRGGGPINYKYNARYVILEG